MIFLGIYWAGMLQRLFSYHNSPLTLCFLSLAFTSFICAGYQFCCLNINHIHLMVPAGEREITHLLLLALLESPHCLCFDIV